MIDFTAANAAQLKALIAEGYPDAEGYIDLAVEFIQQDFLTIQEGLAQAEYSKEAEAAVYATLGETADPPLVQLVINYFVWADNELEYSINHALLDRAETYMNYLNVPSLLTGEVVNKALDLQITIPHAFGQLLTNDQLLFYISKIYRDLPAKFSGPAYLNFVRFHAIELGLEWGNITRGEAMMITCGRGDRLMVSADRSAKLFQRSEKV